MTLEIQKLGNVQEVLKFLKPRQYRKAMTKATRAGSKVQQRAVVGRMKATKNTGASWRSVKVKSIKRSRRWVGTMVTSSERTLKPKDGKQRDKGGRFYTRFPDLGTWKIKRPQEHFRLAFEASKVPAMKEAERVFELEARRQLAAR